MTASPSRPPAGAGARTAANPHRGFVRRLGSETAYLLISWPLALVAFVVVITGLALGAGLLITLIGLPILMLTSYIARGFAHVQRSAMRGLLKVEVPTPHYLRADRGASWLRRTTRPLTDTQTWLDVVHAIVGLITATIGWCFMVVWWAMTLGGLTWAAWGWSIQYGQDQDLPDQLGFPDGYGVRVGFYLVFGLVFALTLPFVIATMTRMHSGLSLVLLSSRASMQQQVDELVEGRAAARSAESTALRRLERDIHDGPQQRLVRLSMDLGRARKQLGDDPRAAETTLDTAIRQARDTLDELRALSRGIAPPILVDRGLTAALHELAGRSTLPVESTLDLPDGLPDHVETAVYFVVAEALTNVAKHSGASHVRIEVTQRGDVVHVRVADDGAGGAHLSKGRGLVGLSDRVRAVDGILNVASPPGGPTVVEAEIPCES
jgi:signal transduction histidine kinase